MLHETHVAGQEESGRVYIGRRNSSYPFFIKKSKDVFVQQVGPIIRIINLDAGLSVYFNIKLIIHLGL